MIVQDIALMPNFNNNVANGSKSVSEGKVFWGKMDWMLKESIDCVCCVKHGACLCVAILDSGRLYRCEACNEGAYVNV